MGTEKKREEDRERIKAIMEMCMDNKTSVRVETMRSELFVEFIKVQC